MRFFAVLSVAMAFAGVTAEAQTLDRIKSEGTFTIGYRGDALPFSFKDQAGEARGYSVDLCTEIAAEIGSHLGVDSLEIDFVEVGTEDRFEAIADGRIDLLCGATTVTLERRETVDFSVLTFVTGATVLYRSDGAASFEALAGQRIGVRQGTTTAEGLNNALAELNVEAEIVPFDDHDAGIDALTQGDVEAYFADRAILIFHYIDRGEPAELVLSDRVFSNEPYALAMAHGDSDFRVAVDRALSRIYSGGKIEEIYGASFGNVPPTDLLRALYRLNALPL